MPLLFNYIFESAENRIFAIYLLTTSRNIESDFQGVQIRFFHIG